MFNPRVHIVKNLATVKPGTFSQSFADDCQQSQFVLD
jgi:hypothetical protein